MKKILVTFLLLSTVLVSAQKRWSAELGVGNHFIADEFVDVSDNYFHLDGVVKYNLNSRFALGVYLGYDELSTYNVLRDQSLDVNYFRAHLEGVVDVFDLLELRNKRFTILSHGGFGASMINNNEGFNEVFPSLSGGFTGLVKLNKTFSLKGDISTTANFNQSMGLDGLDPVTNVGINSFVNNATVGVVVHFGGPRTVEPMEFFEEKKVDELKAVRHKIRELHEAVIENGKTAQGIAAKYDVISSCKCSADENVYFENDKYDIKIQGLNAIEKIFNLAQLDKTKTVYLVGSASPTDTTTPEYDMLLSQNRVERVRAKLLDLGLDDSRIKIDYVGKDLSRDQIHEFARKVSLKVK